MTMILISSPKAQVSILFSAIIAILIGFAASEKTDASILARWVQLGPDGTSSVRAITDEAWPVVTFDGSAVPMMFGPTLLSCSKGCQVRNLTSGFARHPCLPDLWRLHLMESHCHLLSPTRSVFLCWNEARCWRWEHGAPGDARHLPPRP